jgi:hypothetical protein
MKQHRALSKSFNFTWINSFFGFFNALSIARGCSKNNLCMLLAGIFCFLLASNQIFAEQVIEETSNVPVISPLILYGLRNTDVGVLEIDGIYLSQEDIAKIKENKTLVVKPIVGENYSQYSELSTDVYPTKEQVELALRKNNTITFQYSLYTLIGYEFSYVTYKEFISEENLAKIIGNLADKIDETIIEKTVRNMAAAAVLATEPSENVSAQSLPALIIDDKFLEKNPYKNYTKAFNRGAIFYSKAYESEAANPDNSCERTKRSTSVFYHVGLSTRILGKEYEIICNSCVKLTNLENRKSIVALVTDEIDDRNSFDIKVDKKAWEMLSPEKKGKIRVSYRNIDCDTS